MADEVGRLQRGKDAECRLFQSVAEQGHYAGRTKPSATRQGIYALTPEGGFLASVNTRNPGAVVRMLQLALERWRDERARGRDASGQEAVGAESVRRWEQAWPRAGLVLRVHSRDLPREFKRPDWRSRAWNLDYAWFTAQEARSFLPEDPRVVRRCEVPAALVRRIARCHLVDNVRGQTPSWHEKSVEVARLGTRVTAVRGSEVHVELEGEVRLSQRGRWPVSGFEDRRQPGEQERSFRGKLLGRATFDLEAGRFLAFELVAAGARRGGTQFNARGDDPGPAPLGFVFSLAGADERVAPAGIWSYGWKRP